MWIILAISSAALFAVVNIIDKIVLEKWVKDPLVPTIITGFINLIVGFIIFALLGSSSLSLTNIALAFLAGFLGHVSIIIFFRAAKSEEISRIIPLFYLEPLFILVIAAIFLGEIFTPIKYLGILMLVFGAVLISLKNFKKIRFGKSFWLMILSAIILSIVAVLIKYLLGYADFWTIFAYSRFGVIFALIPVLYLSYQNLLNTLKLHGKKVLVVMSLSETLSIAAMLLSIAAVSIGYVTLVTALGSVQPSIVLLFSIILSIVYPKVFEEELKKSIITQKIIAVLFIFIGAILII